MRATLMCGRLSSACVWVLLEGRVRVHRGAMRVPCGHHSCIWTPLLCGVRGRERPHLPTVAMGRLQSTINRHWCMRRRLRGCLNEQGVAISKLAGRGVHRRLYCQTWMPTFVLSITSLCYWKLQASTQVWAPVEHLTAASTTGLPQGAQQGDQGTQQAPVKMDYPHVDISRMMPVLMSSDGGPQ